MPELIAKANQAILEAQWLRREHLSLRCEANVLAIRLGETIARSQAAENRLLDVSMKGADAKVRSL